MCYLLRYQIILVVLLLSGVISATGQGKWFSGEEMEAYERRPYYFGITLGLNQAFYKIDYTPEFSTSESMLRIDPEHFTGFNLGLLGNYKVVNHLDLRFNPMLYFTERNLLYSFMEEDQLVEEEKKLESVLMSLPLQIRLKSDRVGNFGAYLMAGIKYDYDFAANANDRKRIDVVRLQKDDFGYEAGVGVEFYLPYFIFSPEIKFSYGARNIYIQDQENQYTKSIGKLLSRMIVLSFHFEG